ncbi:hypothetical protein BBF96_05310 [Anoxybacter fermentans]|uniref:Transposase IS4-like domain-containing protein n=1 Tax=Anoxybacter fermentans TaxID=1323375 RepID=A0A3Q9HPW0_9FIRM|nr:hypothetical protein [Anoxybacter fermentans]AZR72857.1 hypothetical protein BBF96_05310 [Anoxybacter fermentans]
MIQSNMKKLSRTELMLNVIANFINSLPVHARKRVHKNIRKLADEEKAREFLEKMQGKEYEEVLEILAGKIFELVNCFKNYPEFHNKAYKHLCHVLKDQTIIHEDQLIVKEGKDIPSDALQNPTDEDATYRKKGNKSCQGYAVNITETANKDNPIQLITKVSVEPNIHSDVNFLLESLEDLKERIDIKELIVDGAYCSPETLKETQEKEIKLITTNMVGRKFKNEEKTTADFIVEAQKGIKRCPAGKKPIKIGYIVYSRM